MGLNNYIDPFLKLVCVAINNSPEMDYFYVKEVLTEETKNEMILNATEERDNKGFTATQFASDIESAGQV